MRRGWKNSASNKETDDLQLVANHPFFCVCVTIDFHDGDKKKIVCFRASSVSFVLIDNDLKLVIEKAAIGYIWRTNRCQAGCRKQHEDDHDLVFDGKYRVDSRKNQTWHHSRKTDDAVRFGRINRRLHSGFDARLNNVWACLKRLSSERKLFFDSLMLIVEFCFHLLVTKTDCHHRIAGNHSGDWNDLRWNKLDCAAQDQT